MLIETQDANLIHAIMQQAYAEYRHDASPSSALAETVAGIEQELATDMRAFVWQPDELALAMVKTQWLPDTLYFSRLSVIPSARHQGHAQGYAAHCGQARHPVSGGRSCAFRHHRYPDHSGPQPEHH